MMKPTEKSAARASVRMQPLGMGLTLWLLLKPVEKLIFKNPTPEFMARKPLYSAFYKTLQKLHKYSKLKKTGGKKEENHVPENTNTLQGSGTVQFFRADSV